MEQAQPEIKLCSKCGKSEAQPGQRWCRSCRTVDMGGRRKAGTVSKTRKISSLTQDPHNANKGNKRGREMVATSLKELGAGRSILIDSKGVIIAGNKTASQAEGAGITKVRIIQTDGKELIAVQRMDLDLSTDAVAKRLALADNRTAEIGLSWDQDVLADMTEELDVKFLFGDAAAATAGESVVPESQYKEQFGVIVMCKNAAEQETMYNRLLAEGLSVRVVTT